MGLQLTIIYTHEGEGLGCMIINLTYFSVLAFKGKTKPSTGTYIDMK